jgi:tripartite-type tricarboxylate transporter receptor subunit TctC
MKRALFASILFAAVPFAHGQGFPSKPIRWIVPFAAGSSTDIAGRFFGSQLSAMLGQPVVIENRPGADGAIGIVAAKNSPADGYTQVVAGWTNLTVNPVVMKDLQYDPVRDFKPITGLTRSMLGIAVAPGSSVKSVAELVSAARQSSKQLDFGTFSAGYRLAMEWFASSAGIRFNNVPYKAAGQMNTDLMGGQLAVAIDGMSALGAHARSGKLRVLAVTGERRHPEFPDIPTLRESGYADYAMYGWSALYTRAETPDDITARLADSMEKALASSQTQDYVRKLGAELIGGGPSGMRQFQASQLQNFRRVAQASGIKPE